METNIMAKLSAAEGPSRNAGAAPSDDGAAAAPTGLRALVGRAAGSAAAASSCSLSSVDVQLVAPLRIAPRRGRASALPRSSKRHASVSLEEDLAQRRVLRARHQKHLIPLHVVQNFDVRAHVLQAIAPPRPLTTTARMLSWAGDTATASAKGSMQTHQHFVHHSALRLHYDCCAPRQLRTWVSNHYAPG